MSAPAIRVSVVVPTCGRAALLHRCLNALQSQALDPAEYQIVVVDDRPAAGTHALVTQHAQHAPGLAIHYVANRGPHGPAAARNLGWRHASAPIIAFTDDDTEPDAHWLSRALEAFTADVDVVCGRVVMPIPNPPTDYERDASGLERSEFVTANCLCRREVLERLGGFDEAFTMAWREDSDLHFRLLDQGARIVRAPQAVVVHPVRPAGWGVSLSQQKKVLFDALLFKKHRRLYRERIRSQPRWDYFAISSALLAIPVFTLLGWKVPAIAAAALWLLLTGRFCAHRLRGTSKAPRHVFEMLVTSALIPPVSVLWRLIGAVRFRVPFA